MAEFYSRTTKDTHIITQELARGVVDTYLGLAREHLLPSDGLIPYQHIPDFSRWNSIHAVVGRDIDRRKKFFKEVFDHFSTDDERKKITKLQSKLTERLTDHAHELGIYGIYIRGLRIKGLDKVFSLRGADPNREYARWLREYDNKDSLPDYQSFYLFHLPRLATEILTMKKHIDDKPSLGNALMHAVSERTKITQDASIGRNEESPITGNVYVTHLDMYATAQEQKIIRCILRNRKSLSSSKVPIVPIAPDNVQEPSGINVVVSEAFPKRPARGDRRISGGKARHPQKPRQ